jgi:hypothetical protein
MLDNGAFFKRERNLLQHPLPVSLPRQCTHFFYKALQWRDCLPSVREPFSTDLKKGPKTGQGVIVKNYAIRWGE